MTLQASIDLQRNPPLPDTAHVKYRSKRTRSSRAAVLALLTAVGALALLFLEGTAASVASNLGCAAAGLAAGAVTVRAARRTVGRPRLSWVLIGAGSVAWAIGNLIWSYNQYVVDAEVLFPSIADYFYLAFPLLVGIGLWLMAERNSASRVSSVLDGLIVGGSVLAIAWASTLGAAYRAGGDTLLAFVISLAYPTGDLVLVSMIFLLGLRARRKSMGTYGLLAVGLLGMAVSDTFFAIYSAQDAYVTGGITDLGWFVGLAAIGCAAWRPHVSTSELDSDTPPTWQPAIPYIPFSSAVLVTIAVWATQRQLEPIQVLIEIAVFGAVMIRQLVTLRQNLALNELLRHQAFHDEMTGAVNRNRFNIELQRAVQDFVDDGLPAAVVLVDVDDFKVVNDTFGHDAGDAVLKTLAERLGEAVPKAMLARLGGDEFALLLAGDFDLPVALVAVDGCARVPLKVNGRSIPMSTSVGACVLEVVAPDVDELNIGEVLKAADLALYAAKAGGKDRHAIFTPQMRTRFDDEAALRRDLVEALDTDQLWVAFQPLFELENGRLLGFEALARWDHPERGPVPPDVFIGIAEDGGFMPALGERILHRACREFASWNLPRDVYLSVNVSPSQMVEPGFEAAMRDALKSAPLEAGRLMLEITEQVLLTDEGTVNLLHRLAASGIRIAVDDFGTGYSSLRYLHALPVNTLKIDRSYVSGVAPGTDAWRLISTIMQMAKGLGLETVAEGIETESELEHLKALGCRWGQGYMYSKPLAASDAKTFAHSELRRTPHSV